MPKYQQFFYELLAVQTFLKDNSDLVKKFIGDSTDNHRSISVQQLSRYLVVVGRKQGISFLRRLTTVYLILKPSIKNDRKGFTRRTDAIDINELVSTYRAVVMDDRRFRSTIGRVV